LLRQENILPSALIWELFRSILLHSKKLYKRLLMPKEKINVLFYTPDVKLLIAGTALGGLCAWDAQTYILKAKWNDQKAEFGRPP